MKEPHTKAARDTEAILNRVTLCPLWTLWEV